MFKRLGRRYTFATMLDALFGSQGNKKQQVDELQALITQARDERAALSAMLTQMAGGTSKLAQTSKSLEQGELKQTGSEGDLAINGAGFIEITLPDGSSAYWRGGSLKVNADGMVSTSSGMPLKQGIVIPEGMQKMSIQADGKVQVWLAGQSTPTYAGQLELVRFHDAAALTSMGDGLFVANENTGTPISGSAGQDVACQTQTRRSVIGCGVRTAGMPGPLAARDRLCLGVGLGLSRIGPRLVVLRRRSFVPFLVASRSLVRHRESPHVTDVRGLHTRPPSWPLV